MTPEDRLIASARTIEAAARAIGEAFRDAHGAREELVSDAMARAGKYAVEDLTHVLSADTINHDIAVALQLAGLGEFLDYVQMRASRPLTTHTPLFRSLGAHYVMKVASGVLRSREAPPATVAEVHAPGVRAKPATDPIAFARTVKPV